MANIKVINKVRMKKYQFELIKYLALESKSQYDNDKILKEIIRVEKWLKNI